MGSSTATILETLGRMGNIPEVAAADAAAAAADVASRASNPPPGGAPPPLLPLRGAGAGRTDAPERVRASSADSSMTDPLLDDECAVDVAADFLNPAKTDHKKVMVSDRLVRHICDVLSSGLFNKVAPKLTYKTVDALQVVSWASLWMHMFPERNRKQWAKYVKNLGIP